MIAQPSSVPVKKDVQAALDSARANVSLLEAETARLERIITSQKRDIIVNEGTLKDYDKRIDEATTKATAIATEVVSNERSLETLQALISDKQKSLESMVKGMAETAAEMLLKEKAFTAKETALAELKKELAKDRKTLEKDRTEFEAKVLRLKDTLKDL
jgi:chromosome segregation ATPase